MQDLSTTVTETPCARCGQPVRVEHWTHARLVELVPMFHLSCAIAATGH